MDELNEFKILWAESKKKLPIIQEFVQKNEALILDKIEEGKKRLRKDDATLDKINTPLDDVLSLFEENTNLRSKDYF